MIKKINSESISPEMRAAEDCRDTLETCGKKGLRNHITTPPTTITLSPIDIDSDSFRN